MVSVKVTGLRELGDAMRGLSQEMNLRIARAGTAAGAIVIRDSARSKAPVAKESYKAKGVEVDPGNVPKNIVAKKVPDSQSRFTSEHLVVLRGGRKYGDASHIGALLEFGTVKMAPRPFMRPAFDEKKAEAVDKLKQAIAAGINRATSKL